ncbi:WD40 repeat domain-containing protein [Candidatus Poribacteria bacterium]|nr:WD40 repeat domain-containing protein [Candidatus Poribacteria bacterium]
MENRQLQTTTQSIEANNDVTTWELPEGATTRLGRGRIRGGLTFSPDGDSLVVATDIGCWLYDLDTLTPRALWATERGMVSAISFSHDGQWIAIGNMDGTLKVWDTQTIQDIAKIEETNRLVSSIDFSLDGKHLAIASSTWTEVYAWHVNTTTPILKFAFTRKHRVSHVSSTAFSPDGSLFAYKSGYNLTSVMAIETGEIVAELSDTFTEDPVGCSNLMFSPCGEFLAGCNWKDTVHVWHVQSGNFAMEPTTYHQSTRVLPTYLSDGTLRVAARYSKEIVISDTKLQEKVDSIAYSGGTFWAACFSVDGRKFAIASRYDDIQVWHEGSPSKVVSLPEHLHPDPVQRFPSTLVFSQDSRTLFCGYWKRIGFLAWDDSKRQIDRTFPQKSDEYTAHPDMTFTISCNAELIATAPALRKNSVIRVWDISTRAQIAELKTDTQRVSGLTFSPTGEYLVAGIIRCPIKVWNISSSTQITELTEKDNPLSKMIGRIVFSPTGTFFLSIRKESISVWNTSKWEHLYESTLKGFNRSGTLLRFHPNGKHFFTASREGAAIIWDLKSGEQVGSLPTEICLDTTLYRGKPQDIQPAHHQQEMSSRRVLGLETSPCGTWIAGAMFGEIRIWDAATLQTQMVIILPMGSQKSFILAFSPCSKYLAAGAWWQQGQNKMSIRLWEIATGENIHTFWAHPTDIDRLAFSHDGKILASGSYDGTILLWDTTPYM